jgi:hypothetical protein
MAGTQVFRVSGCESREMTDRDRKTDRAHARPALTPLHVRRSISPTAAVTTSRVHTHTHTHTHARTHRIASHTCIIISARSYHNITHTHLRSPLKIAHVRHTCSTSAATIPCECPSPQEATQCGAEEPESPPRTRGIACRAGPLPAGQVGWVGQFTSCWLVGKWRWSGRFIGVYWSVMGGREGASMKSAGITDPYCGIEADGGRVPTCSGAL